LAQYNYIVGKGIQWAAAIPVAGPRRCDMKGKKKEEGAAQKVDVKKVEVKDLDAEESPKGGQGRAFQMATQMLRMKHDMGGPVDSSDGDQD
jgi:hypothetical protein